MTISVKVVAILKAAIRQFWLSIVALAIAFSVAFVINLPAQAQVEKYLSRGKPIRVEWFRPSHDSGKPVVLILYGASGGEDSDYFRSCAQQFADAGFVAGVVHYFDSVDIKWANSAQMSKYFQSWLGTVDDAVTCSQKQFGAKRKVDIFGYSLGAQLALSFMPSRAIASTLSWRKMLSFAPLHFLSVYSRNPDWSRIVRGCI